MTQSNQSQNSDNYREPISESDLEKDSFSKFFNTSQGEKEAPKPLKENFYEGVEKVEDGKNEAINNVPSIKESIMIEESGEGNVEEEIMAQNQQSTEVLVDSPLERKIEVKEEVLAEPIVSEEKTPIVEEEEQATNIEDQQPKDKVGDSPLERKIEVKEEVLAEPIVSEEKTPMVAEEKVINPLQNKPETREEINNYIKEAIEVNKEQPAVEEKKEEVVEETKVNEEEKKEEVQIIQESYKEIRDIIWNKVNPSNADRFKALNMEETDENRSFLNDISVKITLLDDDFEDGFIKEEEAIQKIKEIKEKLNF